VPKTNISQVSATGAEFDISAERKEMLRRKKMLSAMMALATISLDQLTTRARHGAQYRTMPEMESFPEARINGVLSETVMLSSREWAFVVELLSQSCRTVLKNELSSMPAQRGPLASIFDREEKRTRDRQSLIIGACGDIADIDLREFAVRILRAGVEFYNVEDAHSAVLSIIEKKARITPGQWLNISQVFIGAALQAIEKEQQARDDVRIDEPGPRAEYDARIIAACMLIGSLSVDQVVRRLSYAGKTFGIDSLADKVEEKFNAILNARCVLTDTERMAVLRVALSPAVAAFENELMPGIESTTVPSRFAELIKGSMKLMDLTIEDVATNVSRLANRWFLGRLETKSKDVLSVFLKDPAAIDLTADERRIVAHSVFSVPLQMIKAELEACK
jgi:hypothetical protein